MRFTILKARDPSLIHCCMTNVEMRGESVDDEDHLLVYLRIKDGIQNYEDLYEVLDSKTIVSKVPETLNLRLTDDDKLMKKYSFSKVFKPETTQMEIFRELVQEKLLKFINGHNSSLLTYGVSSSGKTYTILGTAAEPGIIPRSLEYLFRTLPVLAKVPTVKPLPNGEVSKLTLEQLDVEIRAKKELLNFNWPKEEKNEHVRTYCKMESRLSEDAIAEIENYSHLEVTVWVSFAEIYNEHIYDLLQSGTTKRQNLKLGCSNDQTYVKNLKLVHVTSGLEAYQLLQYGLNNLNYAKTKINDHSSRSHSIFTIWLTQAGIDSSEGYHISHFNFCDLAGAERSKKTMNSGDRLKESNNINTSLLVLGRCIAAVRKAQQSSDQLVIPFRESKLTQLFRKALSGHEEISMIVNINPCRELFDETQHVLNFSAIAKDIVVVERPIQLPVRSERISQLLTPLKDAPQTDNDKEIENLQNQLAEVVCRIEQENLDIMKESEILGNRIKAEYTRKLEEFGEEKEYQLFRSLQERHKLRLQAAKLELMQKLGATHSDLYSDSDSDSGTDLKKSNVEVISISSSDEESFQSEEEEVETVVISDDEEEPEDINEWWEKVEHQESLIAERSEEISHLRGQIEAIKLKYGEDLGKIRSEQDLKLEVLKRKLQVLEDNRTYTLLSEKLFPC